ncbi:MAG: hypothetical protein M1820_001614 [Bogoriella megaspora]|nr:MAG: hypothetical protein M1820_001614 [Bogoriella megaspora]
MSTPRKLWENTDPEETAMYRFLQTVNQRHDLHMKTFEDLYQWSITSRLPFWSLIWETLPLISSGTPTSVIDNPSARMDSFPQPKWFPGTYLNYAENLLFTPDTTDRSIRTHLHKRDGEIACTQVREGASSISHMTWGELRRQVGLLSNALRAAGVRKGDRIAAVASHGFSTLIVFLATTTLGALFSSMGTDMGTKGILDRLVQIRPVYVFFDDASLYNGRTVDLSDKMREVVEGLSGVEEFKEMVSVQRFEQAKDVGGVLKATTFKRFVDKAKGNSELVFERIAFHEPFLVVYSSGTTGQPKCIVHSVGGYLINAKKEGVLHHDTSPQHVTLQYTTTSWIMYLSSVSALLHGCRVVIYDGSPFQPDLKTLIQLVSEQKVTSLGISPRYLSELQKNKIRPREIADLSFLQEVSSTGMVLSDALFEWFYDEGFPSHIHLANISGGTDMAGCFGINNPLTPLYVGGTQGPSLGMKVEVFEQIMDGETKAKGKPLEDGVPGELVCTTGFPNQPVMFWGENGQQRYFDAYYAKFDGVWHHGDFIMKHPVTKGIIFLGRADGVLNPSGVRFGSSEIYSIIEAQPPQIANSICVGQRRPTDTDETVILFLMMKPEHKFTSQLVAQVKEAISKGLSKRHVPKYVFETPEIPTTVNLKKVELPVKQIVSGKTVKPSGTLLNPQSLDFYYQFAKVEELEGPRSKL